MLSRRVSYHRREKNRLFAMLTRRSFPTGLMQDLVFVSGTGQRRPQEQLLITCSPQTSSCSSWYKGGKPDAPPDALFAGSSSSPLGFVPDICCR
jgi:hypothetical protein